MSNKAALAEFVQLPVSPEMVKYLATKASEVIRCEPVTSDLPTPPSTPPRDTIDASEPRLPDLESFIRSIVERSHVQVPTLMTSLIYLARLKKRLPPVAKGMRCTVHRIFLAALILSAKNLNDSSPKNKHWARYTTVKGYDGFGFSLTEVNLMEKQLLFLLDWDLNISPEDLYENFEPFLSPIRRRLRLEEEQELAAIAQRELELRERELQQERERQQRKKKQEAAQYSRSVTPVHAHLQTPLLEGENIEAYYQIPRTVDLRHYPVPPTPHTPSRDPRSRSSSRSRTSSSYSTYRRTLERSRSRSTHRRSLVSLDQMVDLSPPSSGQIPELARSGTTSSIYSNESSPRLPSPSVVAQVHFLSDHGRESPKYAHGPAKLSKKSRTNIFSRILGVDKSPFERAYFSRS